MYVIIVGLECNFPAKFQIKMNSNDLCDEVLISLRRIVRAVDYQSRQLVRSHGLTSPQTLILKELMQIEEATVGQLADNVSLSKPTVTDILNRLERRGLVTRTRSDKDKRCIKVRVTPLARKKLADAPPLLQEEFTRQFSNLEKWEQFQLLGCLNRVAEMLHVRELEASPYLSGDPLSAPSGISQIRTEAEEKNDSLAGNTGKLVSKNR